MVNWFYFNDFVCFDIFFGMVYGDDLYVVCKVVIKVVMFVGCVLNNLKVFVCYIVGFGDSLVDYIFCFWISDFIGGFINI